MDIALDRRSFLQAAGAAGAALGLGALASAEPARKIASAIPHGDKLGWRLCNTCYTFNSFCFFDALEKTAGLNIRYTEGFSWQPVSKNRGEGQMNETMPPTVRKQVKKRLDDLGVKLLSCYMGSLPNDEAAARKKFEFGKEMGMEYFVSEPPPAAMDLMEKLCDEYGISIAIHNHPKPSSVYWNPAEDRRGHQGPHEAAGRLLRHRPLGPLGAETGRLPEAPGGPDHQLPSQGHRRVRKG